MKTLSSCGCCDGVSQDTPLKIANRPGLSAIEYRIGEHHDFKSSLLSGLSKSQLTSLQKLTSRSDDDFSIALLDAFSTVADVLTFYQERIANESYLNTATEQLSIVELARLIGYELSPGVAANTYLSFTIDDKSLQPGQEIISGIKSSGNEMPIVKIAKGTQIQSIPEQDEEAQFFETIEEIRGKSDWNAMELRTFIPQASISTSSELFIEGLDNNLKVGDFLFIKENGKDDIKRKIQEVEPLKELDITKLKLQIEPLILVYFIPQFILYQPSIYYVEKKTIESNAINDLATVDSGAPKSIPVNQIKSIAQIQNWNNYELKTAVNFQKPVKLAPELYVFRNRASLFGYNAPTEVTLNNKKVAILDKLSEEENKGEITLDNEYPEITGGKESFVAVQDKSYSSATIYQVDQSELLPASKYGLNGKSTKLTLKDKTQWWSGQKLSDLRKTTVHIQSEKLRLSQIPIDDKLAKGTSDFFLSKFYIDLEVGQKILISGEIDQLAKVIRSELHTIKEVYLQEGLTRIFLEKPLLNTYVRKTVRVNANVALASHGATVNEILGSGDASQTFQKFTLKNKPLTYTSSDTPTGTETSLEIRVNDVLWTEVSSLYQKKPDDHVYITRQNSEGQTTVIFGDGIFGSRLPTGNQNIHAVYRKGTGQAGLLKSNQLSQLVSKPLYLKAVNNPLAPSGAQDGEKLIDARANANLAMYTLDRIVSLQDYEDFTKAFAGIAKSKAIWMWTDVGKVVHITIAGVNGAEVKSNSTLYKNLQKALNKNAFPGTSVKLDNYRIKHFVTSGNLKVDNRYKYKTVHTNVIAELKKEFSFSRRNLGQDITLSEVLSVIQSVEGVVYVDIDSLHFLESTGSTLQKRLVSHAAVSGTNQPSPAELIIIQPAPFEFKQIQ